ncbi:MAG: hypothetical protein IT286_03450 [Proteobacteria bacterium]|jgi:hypothetical protein|nr:hypothetical protein [Pseudomonadota bacterium]
MRSIWVFSILLMISASSNADDFFNPPPLNPELPPWMQESSPPSNQPGSAPPPQPGPDSAPPMAEPMPFDGDDEDGGAAPFDFDGSSSGGGGGGGGRGSDQGKTSFQVLDEVQRGKSGPDCVGWGSAFLGTKVYNSESMCRNELDQQLENARDKINNYTDHTEKEVLRGVIKGKIPREKSKDFHLDFTELKSSLSIAGKSGCKCLE